MEIKIKKLVIASVLIIFIILMVLLITNLKTDINAFAIGGGNVTEITIDAKMFEFSPNIIKVKEGERIRLKINNLDVEHSIIIPELEIHIHSEGMFVAKRKGTFNFYCHSYCGSGHDAMKGILIVE